MRGRLGFLGALLALTACSVSPGFTPSSAAPRASRTPGPLLPAATGETMPPARATTLAQRCGVAAAGQVQMLQAPGGRLETVTTGSGPVTAVYLHQTGGQAFCGWAPYAAWAGHHGIRGVLVNLCGYGRSTCGDRLTGDPVGQVRAVLERLRGQGAHSLVLVGASMGGAIALSAAARLPVDGVVDLSGPDQWPGCLPLAQAARGVHAALFVAVDPNDESPGPYAEAVRSAPAADAVFVGNASGHGWETLTDHDPVHPRVSGLGERLLRWLTERTPGSATAKG